MECTAEVSFFLQKTRVIPKGLRSRIPKSIAVSNYGSRLQKRYDNKIMAKSISNLHAKEYEVDKKLAELRLTLQEKFEIFGQNITKIESNLARIA